MIFLRIIIFVLVGNYFLQTSYCDYNIVDMYNVDILEKLLDNYNSFGSMYDYNYSCDCSDVYQNISTCDLKNHMIKKKISIFRRLFNCCIFLCSFS